VYTLVVIIHLIVSIFLIFVVLIQGGKGAEIGAVFGGSTQTLFGSRGAVTFLNKLTTIVAIVFMLTSLSLAVLSINRSSVAPEKVPVKTSPVTSPSQPAGPIQEQAPKTAPVQPQQAK